MTQSFYRSRCKNGRICLSFINKRHCPVCVFHMTVEYKKTGSKRGELQVCYLAATGYGRCLNNTELL